MQSRSDFGRAVSRNPAFRPLDQAGYRWSAYLLADMTTAGWLCTAISPDGGPTGAPTGTCSQCFGVMRMLAMCRKGGQATVIVVACERCSHGQVA